MGYNGGKGGGNQMESRDAKPDDRMGMTNGQGARNGYNADASFGSRRPFDVSRVKCFRCDKLGHFVRDCPDLPKRANAAEEKPALNG